MIEDPCVIYTHGYSVENEIVDARLLSEAIDVHLPGHVDNHEIVNLLEPLLSKTITELRWPVIGDQILSFYERSLIPRRGHEYRRFFNISSADSPARIAIDRVVQGMHAARASITHGRAVPSPRIDFDISRRAFGHMLWWLAFRLCRSVLRHFGHAQTISETSFQAATISRLSDWLRQPEFRLHAYYREATKAALKVALV